MKQYSPSALERSATVWRPERLHEHCDLVAHVRSLVITDGKTAVAKRLGIAEKRLTRILRDSWPLPDRALAALGYRKITRFERID